MRLTSCWPLLLFAAAASAQPAPAETPAATPAAAPAPVPTAAPADGTAIEVESAPPPAAPALPNSGDEAYRLKIDELEGRVNELKEDIFRTKTRLAILKESVLSSAIAGAEAHVEHRNEMGSSFTLEKVTYSLDGTPIFSKVDQDGDLDGRESLEIFNGPIVPGNHTVSVVMVYRGNGFGIFSYLRGYVFTLRSSHTFHADEGKRIEVKVIGYEKGGVTTDLKDRPDVRFEDQLDDAASAAERADRDG
ncbi:MAG: dihydrolipoamide acetyltransferase [Myxococcales bacterium]|nr:dihydrolipoamide acetyltransferase [Myxococcales bacterium]